MQRGKREIHEVGTKESKPRQHLYIILDDWACGFSIRKVDLELDQLIPGGRNAREAAAALPSACLRFGARQEPPIYFSDALGSKILAMQPEEEGRRRPDMGGLCYDVHERSLNRIPRHSQQLMPIYFPIGDRLFALGRFSMELLDLQPLVSGQPGALSWRKLPDAPVDSMHVFSRAVHPDGKTIFISVNLCINPTTYSFHMAEDGSFRWENLGKWKLPFDGYGRFIPELGTWVGVSLYAEEPGRVCSCELASTTSDCRPEVKYSKEYLFREDPAEKHLGSSLVYMGGHDRKFCLVECIEVGNRDHQGNYSFAGDQENRDDQGHYCNFGEENVDPPPPVRMFRLTKFSLTIDENGDLTTGDTRRVRYYKVPNKDMNDLTFAWPLAFWL
ncbi:unnamed protein product [Alopecurus aequalis]